MDSERAKGRRGVTPSTPPPVATPFPLDEEEMRTHGRKQGQERRPSATPENRTCEQAPQLCSCMCGSPPPYQFSIEVPRFGLRRPSTEAGARPVTRPNHRNHACDRQLHELMLPAVGEVFLSQRTRPQQEDASADEAPSNSVKLSMKNAEALNLSIGLCSSSVSPCSFEMPSISAGFHTGPFEGTRSRLTVEKGSVEIHPATVFRVLATDARLWATPTGSIGPDGVGESCHSCLTTMSDSPAHRLRLCGRPVHGCVALLNPAYRPAHGQLLSPPATRGAHGACRPDAPLVDLKLLIGSASAALRTHAKDLPVQAEELVDTVVPCRQIRDDGIRTARHVGQHLGQDVRWSVHRHGDGETLCRQLRQPGSVGHDHLPLEGDGLHNGDRMRLVVAHQGDDVAGSYERAERLSLRGVERCESHGMFDLQPCRQATKFVLETARPITARWASAPDRGGPASPRSSDDVPSTDRADRHCRRGASP